MIKTTTISLILLCSFFTLFAQVNEPDWSVEVVDFEFSANMTSIIQLNLTETGNGNILAAFYEDQCVGVTTPILVLDNWIYFLTFYSNSINNEITFKTYIGTEDIVIDIEESVLFQPNAIFGSPIEPYELNAFMDFDHAPEIADIPDQSIVQGEDFQSIDLDSYLTELDGDEIVWSYTGDTDLIIEIDTTSQVDITLIDQNWVGEETITFTATDQTSNGYYASDEVIFSIESADNAPQVTEIPDQTIGLLGSFQSIPLDDYLVELDGDDILWGFEFLLPEVVDAIPGWSINPADYQLSMTLTAKVAVEYNDAVNPASMLAAFVDNECRGLVSPIEVMGNWIFFMSIYSNTNSEELQFKIYDAEKEQILPVLEEMVFTSNEIYGSPTEPYDLQATYLLVNIDPENIVSFEIVDDEWYGFKNIKFIATDQNTSLNHSGETDVIFTVINDHTPVVENIPDQTIELTTEFRNFDLDNYLTELDGDDVVWSFLETTNLTVDIDESNIAVIIVNDPEWMGEEIITFIATDEARYDVFGSDDAVFSVVPLDNPPQINVIPDQEITLGEEFESIIVSDYLAEIDGDDVNWMFKVTPSAERDNVPDWNINPADFENTMTVTAKVKCYGENAIGNEHYLAAFYQDECRGVVTEAIQILDEWIYFLTISSNVNSEEITFKFFNAEFEQILPALETIEFLANAEYGTPTEPVIMNAGIFYITLDDSISIKLIEHGWTGIQEMLLIVEDSGSLHEYSDTAFVDLIVYNDQPVVSDIQDISLDEDTFVSFSLDEYVSDFGTYVEDINWSVSNNIQLEVEIVDRVVTITPTANWFGIETITFTAADDNLYTPLSDSNIVVVSVLPLNDTPFIESGIDTVYLFEDIVDSTSINYNSIFNDYDIPFGDSLIFTYRADSASATFQVRNGFLQITPDPDWHGTFIIECTATDDSLAEASEEIEVIVNSVEDPPRLIAPIEDFSFPEDTVDNSIDLNNAFIDPDNLTRDTLSFSYTGNVNIAVTMINGQITLTPPPDWSGVEELIFTATGEYLETASDTVNITVSYVNDNPIIQNLLSDVYMNEDTVDSTSVNYSNIFYDPDIPFGDQLEYSYSTGPDDINITLMDSIMILQPEHDWFGEKLIIMRVTDNADVTISYLLRIHVINVDDPPEISLPDSILVQKNNTIVQDFTPYIIEKDEDPLTLTVQNNENISVSIDGLEVTFIPDTDWEGLEELTFIIDDQQTRSTAADSVVILVTQIILVPPANITISQMNGSIRIEWDPVPYASEYVIYSSQDPHSGFEKDESGTFDGNSWTSPVDSDRKFYKVTSKN